VPEHDSYSLIKLSQEPRNLEPYLTDVGPIDTVKMAEACGVDGVRTANPDELSAAARWPSTVNRASSSPYRWTTSSRRLF
jgi:acetolactate synthase I/II/III large subunit